MPLLGKDNPNCPYVPEPTADRMCMGCEEYFFDDQVFGCEGDKCNDVFCDDCLAECDTCGASYCKKCCEDHAELCLVKH